MRKLDVDSYDMILKDICKNPCGTVYPLSIAERKQYGDIFLSDDSVLLWHYSGFAYIFGSCKDNFLKQIYREFLTADGLPRRFILFTADPKVELYFRNKTRLVFGRRYYFEYPQETEFSPKPLPQGYEACKFEKTVFDSIEGRITPRFSWRNAEEFQNNGMGQCITHRGKPVSWAFSAAVSSNELDIGIETSPEYRHKGLAVFAAEQMIKYCLKQRKLPVWSCDTGNIASRKLAEKLGFSVVAEYTTIRAE